MIKRLDACKKMILITAVFVILCTFSMPLQIKASLIKMPGNGILEKFPDEKITSISEKSIKLDIGKYKTIKIKNTHTNVKWTTSNKKVATIKPGGKYKASCKITAKKAGKATIQAKVGKKIYKCIVTVKTKPEKDESEDEHTHTFEITTKDATCEEDGYTTYECECGESETFIIEAAGHQLRDPVIEKSATCTEDGIIYQSCKACDYVSTEVIDAYGHNYITDSMPVTCLRDGYETITCTICGDTHTDIFPATGHDYKTTSVPADCTQDGYETTICKNCGEIYEKVFPATGHEYDEGIIIRQVSKKEDGLIRYTCKTCGNTKEDVISSSSHHFNEGIQTKKETCSENGVITYSCTDEDCGYTYTEHTPTLAHTFDESLTCIECGHSMAEDIEIRGSFSTGLNSVGIITASDTRGYNDIIILALRSGAQIDKRIDIQTTNNIKNETVKKISFVPYNDEPIKLTTAKSLFGTNNNGSEYKNLTKIEGIDYLDTGSVTSTSNMFQGCRSLTSLDLSNLNLQNVVDASKMFDNCLLLTSLSFGNNDFKNVKDASYMFYQCRSIISLDISKFHMTSVTDTSHMFDGCVLIKNIDAGNIRTENVKSTASMFKGCESLTSLNVSAFTLPYVEDASHMFGGCSMLQEIDITKFDMKNAVNISSMFEGCSSLTSLQINWDTKNCISMARLFKDCLSLNEVNINTISTINVTDMTEMFYGCSSLKNLDLTSFDTGLAQNRMHHMFYQCWSLNYINATRGKWISNEENMIFEKCNVSEVTY